MYTSVQLYFMQLFTYLLLSICVSYSVQSYEEPCAAAICSCNLVRALKKNSVLVDGILKYTGSVAV